MATGDLESGRQRVQICGSDVAHQRSLAWSTAPHNEHHREEITKRLAALFDVVVAAATENHLDSALAYADNIAAQRQQSGHDLGGLQLAINALEEQLWHAVMEDAPVDAQGFALGMVSTILGAIKDRLACEYVSRAAGKPTRTLRIDELFRGTAAGQV